MSEVTHFFNKEKFYLKTFSKSELYKVFDNGIYPKEKIENNRLIDYLYEYFTDQSSGSDSKSMHAKTILVEEEYLSESYLNDIRVHYWNTYRDYNKFCRRLHFFNEKISKQDFVNKVLEKDKSFFNKTYLGYVIIKPTGNSLFGPTFLKVFESNSEKQRCYNSILKMTINLFGINIDIEGLIFQEQDKAIGVCATQAIWSAMNKLSYLFRIPMLSPSEISSYGGISSANGRIFPNSGLSNKQIFKVFEKNSLTVELMSLSKSGQNKMDKNLFKQIVYAYNKVGIPILLGYYAYNTKNKKSDKRKQRHIVTIVGYRLDKKDINKNRSTFNLKTVADRILRLYVHNDQIGPYTKIGFDEGENNSPYVIQTNWIGTKFEDVIYDSLLVPVKKYIRIRYHNVSAAINKLDEPIIEAFSQINVELEWDIYLDKGTNYKRDILDTKIKNSDKIQIITESFPKYIWIARLRSYSNDKESKVELDIIYDSSESPSNFCLHRVYFFNREIGKTLVKILDNETNSLWKLLYDRISDQHINFLKSELKKMEYEY